MCDIDHFKSVNDTFGHSVGDKVIQQMAECVAQTVRENDQVCRYGGEEFCVLLAGLDAAAAAQVAERVRAGIEAQAAQKLRLTGERTITASFGVTDLSHDATDLAELIDQADRALVRSGNLVERAKRCRCRRDNLARFRADLKRGFGRAFGQCHDARVEIKVGIIPDVSEAVGDVDDAWSRADI